MAAVGTNKLQAICQQATLIDGGRGHRFHVRHDDDVIPAFVIRYQGQAHAYLNQCSHQALELDWKEGDFFDRSGELLICATHGARYRPDSGACVSGQCRGKGLTKLGIVEAKEQVYLIEQNGVEFISDEDG